MDLVWLLALGVIGQAGRQASARERISSKSWAVGGVEVLELGCQGGALGFGGGDGDATDGEFRKTFYPMTTSF